MSPGSQARRRALQAVTLLTIPVASACGSTAPGGGGGGGQVSAGAGGGQSSGAGLPAGVAGTSSAASLCRYGGGGNSACYAGTLTVTGAVTASGSFSSPMFSQGSCQSWMTKFAGKSSERGVDLPSINLSDGSATFSAQLVGFTGPGIYQLGLTGSSHLAFGGSGGVIAGGVDYTGPVSGAAQTATATADVKGDGSFTVTFSNLADGNNPSQTVSGTAVYKCTTF